MKHSLFIAFFLCLGSFASAQQLTSPDGNLSLEFMEQADGVPAYRLDYKGKPVLTSGRLGLLTEEADLTRGFKQTNLFRPYSYFGFDINYLFFHLMLSS